MNIYKQFIMSDSFMIMTFKQYLIALGINS